MFVRGFLRNFLRVVGLIEVCNFRRFGVHVVYGVVRGSLCAFLDTLYFLLYKGGDRVSRFSGNTTGLVYYVFTSLYVIYSARDSSRLYVASVKVGYSRQGSILFHYFRLYLAKVRVSNEGARCE